MTQRLARAGMVAALYVVLTWAFAPLSYGPIQFRVAEILKSAVLWNPDLVPAFAVGVFVANLTSPYVGPWELLFMPLANLVGGLLCVWIGRRSPWAGAAVFAGVIAAAVSVMLSVIVRAPIAVTLPGLLLSEGVLIVGGLPIMATVWRRARLARVER